MSEPTYLEVQKVTQIVANLKTKRETLLRLQTEIKAEIEKTTTTWKGAGPDALREAYYKANTLMYNKLDNYFKTLNAQIDAAKEELVKLDKSHTGNFNL